eukprot:536218_1
MKAMLVEVAMKEVKTFVSEKEIVISKRKMETQNEFGGKLKMDGQRLNEWKIDSISIKNELQSEQKEQELNDRDESNTHLLLDRFIECKALCDKQQIRMESVAMHCTKLNNIKKILKKEKTQCNEMVSTMEKETEILNARHRTLQTKRIEQQTQWMNALKEMNKTIAEENATNDAKCGAQNQYETSSLEAKQWNLLYTKCAQLIKQYQVFDEENEQNMQQMMQMFDGLWNTFMKRWFAWQPKDIICWMKYLQIQHELTLSN